MVGGKEANARDTNGKDLGGAIGGVEAKAGRVVGDAVEVRGVGDDPKRGHGINEGMHEVAIGRRAECRWYGRSGHGGGHHTVAEGAKSGGVGFGGAKGLGVG